MFSVMRNRPSRGPSQTRTRNHTARPAAAASRETPTVDSGAAEEAAIPRKRSMSASRTHGGMKVLREKKPGEDRIAGSCSGKEKTPASFQENRGSMSRHHKDQMHSGQLITFQEAARVAALLGSYASGSTVSTWPS